MNNVDNNGWSWDSVIVVVEREPRNSGLPYPKDWQMLKDMDMDEKDRLYSTWRDEDQKVMEVRRYLVIDGGHRMGALEILWKRGGIHV